MQGSAGEPVPQLDVRMFGGLEITYREEETSPPHPLTLPPTAKSQSLLAYLLLHSEPPPTRERLATLFWGDRPPRRARRSLSTALWHIRRCCPLNPLQSEGQTIRFAFPGKLHLDVAAFELLTAADASLAQLEEGVALYRGDFLEGLYDDWIILLRYRWQSRYLDALLRLMQLQEAGAEDRKALQTALRLLELDELSEAACQTALRTYARLGQREPALELYRRFEARLQEALGIPPSEETIALYRRVLEGGPQETSATPGPLPWAKAEHRRERHGTAVPFVGREAEMDFWRRFWPHAVAGGERILFVAGEAGVGKSRLVEQFAAYVARRGGYVATGHCSAFEQAQPYVPLTEWLQEALMRSGPYAMEALSSWEVGNLALLLPELRSPSLPTPPTFTEAEQRHLFQAALHLLLTIAQRRPMLLIAEDLHWAHDSWLAWLRFLARRSGQARLVVVGTYRQEEVPTRHPLAHLVVELVRAGAATRLDLQPLSLRALGQWFPDAPSSFLHQLHRHTEGNPFFILETLRALQERYGQRATAQPWQIAAVERMPIPETVRQAIRLRRDRLGPEARRALEVAAVIGRTLDLELWQRAWGRPEGDLLAVLDGLLRRQWLVEGRGTFAEDYEFAHHLGRETLYADLPAERRRTLHRRVAEAIEGMATPDHPRSAEIALHYLRAEAWEQAWPHLLQAGDQAVGMAATDEALACYRQAQSVHRHLPEERRQPLDGAVLERRIGEVYFRRGEYERARKHLLRALRMLGHPFPTEPWRIWQGVGAALLRQFGRRLFAVRQREREPQDAEAAAVKEEVLAYTSLGWIDSLQGRYAPYLLVALRALNASENGAFPQGEAYAATALGIACDFLPAFRLATYFHRRAAAQTPFLVRPSELGFVHFGMAYHAYLLADESQALEEARLAADAYRRAGDPHRWALAVLIQGYIHGYRGELERVESLAAELWETGESMRDPSACCAAESLRGRIARWAGGCAEAAEHFRAAADFAAQVPDHMSRVENLGQLARCLARLGDSEAAEEAVRQGMRTARQEDVRGDSLAYFLHGAAEASLLLTARPVERRRGLRRLFRAAHRATRAFRPLLPAQLRLEGMLAWRTGHPRRARRLWQRSLLAARHLHHPLDWGATAFEMGHCLGQPVLMGQGEARLSEAGAEGELRHLRHFCTA